MAKGKKIRRPRKALSDKQIERLKQDISRVAEHKTWLLSIAVMADTLNLDDTAICEVAKDMERWAAQIDRHVLRINEIADIIERKAGLKFGRF